MESRAQDGDRAASPIIAGIVDVLNIQCAEKTVVKRHGKIVVTLHDLFGTVGQPAVAQHESEAAPGEVFAMVTREAVTHKSDAEGIARAVPPVTAQVTAERDGLIHFGIIPGFMLAFVPTGADKTSYTPGEFLFGVDREAVFERDLLG